MLRGFDGTITIKLDDFTSFTIAVGSGAKMTLGELPDRLADEARKVLEELSCGLPVVATEHVAENPEPQRAMRPGPGRPRGRPRKDGK
jgi:hypothetical protein